MSNELISKLSKLKLERGCIKRNIDTNYKHPKIKTELFERLKEVDKEIEKVKFKLKLEKEMKKDDIKH